MQKMIWPIPNPFPCGRIGASTGTLTAKSKAGIREMGGWMREHDPEIAESLADFAAVFGASELSYSGLKQDELRAHMNNWRTRKGA